MPLLTRYDLTTLLAWKCFDSSHIAHEEGGELDNYYILYGMALDVAVNSGESSELQRHWRESQHKPRFSRSSAA
jgi:hypothetical protein